MAVRIDRALCLGCGVCVEACPGDLLVLKDGCAGLRAEHECWLCLSCAKACPRGAIAGVLPFVLGDTAAELRPRADEGALRRICRHPDGKNEEFLIGALSRLRPDHKG